MNSIDPRRLVSHEGDVEEAAREYEASKAADAAKKKATTDDSPKVADGDKSKTSSGVSYAEYAKNAQSAPQDKPTGMTVTPIEHKGARGVEITLAHPPRKDADVKVGTLRAEVGTQNEIGVTVASKTEALGKTGDIKWSASGEVGHAGAHLGVQNSDGSTGVNAGVGAAAGSFGITAEDQKSGAKVTVGVEAGVSAGGSFGFKDRADGKADACLQASIGPVQIGMCMPTSLPGIVHHDKK